MPAEVIAKGYESPELRPRWFIVGLIVVALLLFGAGFTVMRFYQHLLAKSAEVSPARSVAAGMMEANDAPPLQPQQGHEQVDAQDLAEMHLHESAVFDQLGWKWDDAAQQRTVPAAVIAAVRNRSVAARPSHGTSAERGAP